MGVLTFDWDDVSISNSKVQQALSQLTEYFGPERVWYRISSSGQGLHVLVGELDNKLILRPMTVEEPDAFRWRSYFHSPPFELECGGRLRADNVRQAHGFPTGRLFSHKDEHEAGPWMLFER